MSDDDFQSLKDSIEVNGVLNPVTIFDGQVIDGWHRYTAANELSIECQTVELGDVDPRDFVLAQNRARRHVTQAQLALATTAVYAWKPVGNPAFSQLDTECPIGKTNAELSKISGVHANTIKQAKAVQTKAAPEVVEAVKRGEIGLPKAAAISKLPKDQQVAAINKPISKQEKPRTVEPLHLVTPTGEVLTAADMGADDPLEMLKEMQQDLEAAHKQIEILTQDDTKAELHKMILQRDHAVRRQSEEMDKAFASQKREKRTKALLMRCGKAVGEDDPEKIPATVEAMARTVRKAA